MNNIYPLLLIVFLFGCNKAETEKNEDINLVVNQRVRVMSGLENWKGANDCSFTAMIYKESLGIRISIDVKDDDLVYISKDNKNKDAVEIYFDTRPYRLKHKNRYMKGVFQVTVVPYVSKSYENKLTFFPKYYHSEIPGAQVISKINPNSDGYKITVFLPYSGFIQNHYTINNKFNFDIAVNDIDSDGSNSKLIWAGNTDDWKNPLGFKTLHFK